MLKINIQKVLKNSTVENLHQLAGKIGFRYGNHIYKYENPDNISMIRLSTISAIVKEIATRKKIKPEDVKIGDIFDWKD
jgi:hypothetical protein